MRELKTHKCKTCSLKIVLVSMDIPQKDKTVKELLSWNLCRMYYNDLLPHIEYTGIKHCPFCGKKLLVPKN